MGFQNRRPDVKPPSIAGCQGKVESSVEVTHLALARRQNTGNGTLGNGRLRVLQIAVPFLFANDSAQSADVRGEVEHVSKQVESKSIAAVVSVGCSGASGRKRSGQKRNAAKRGDRRRTADTGREE